MSILAFAGRGAAARSGVLAGARGQAWAGGLFVAAVAACNLLHGLADAPGPVWDENYYLTSYARYAEGRATFASHPPLGLLLITAGDRLSGLNRHVDLAGLARSRTLSGARLPPGFDLTGPRLAPALFGVLALVGVYGLMLSLVRRPLAAVFWAGLPVFDTALLAQFRAAQLDAFQMAFAALALLTLSLAVRASGPRRLGAFAAHGAMVGAAAMVKLDGVLLAVPAAAWAGLLIWRGRAAPSSTLRTAAAALASLAAGLAATVTGVLVLQLAAAPRAPDSSTPAGAVDARALSPAYAAYLHGAAPLSAAAVLAAGRDDLDFALADDRGMPRQDPNAAPALLQPLMQKPINYRWDRQGDRTAYVQLVPNPVVWLTALAAVAGAAILLLLGSSRRAADPLFAPLVAGWTALTAAHALMGLHRATYLYHAFLPLLFGLSLAPLAWRGLCDRAPGLTHPAPSALTVLGAATLAAFVFYAPLALHHPLTHAACVARNALGPVVRCQP